MNSSFFLARKKVTGMVERFFSTLLETTPAAERSGADPRYPRLPLNPSRWLRHLTDRGARNRPAMTQKWLFLAIDSLRISGQVIIVAVALFIVLSIFVPAVQQLGTRAFTDSEQVAFPGDSLVQSPGANGRTLELVTLLPFDAIPAILDPSFVTPAEAEGWMDPNEQVLGLSINGEHRAYSIKMLSRHEIVNDVVGGVPVAVTW